MISLLQLQLQPKTPNILTHQLNKATTVASTNKVGIAAIQKQASYVVAAPCSIASVQVNPSSTQPDPTDCASVSRCVFSTTALGLCFIPGGGGAGPAVGGCIFSCVATSLCIKQYGS